MALKLLSVYSSGSEEEDDDGGQNIRINTRNRLPLPECIATWKGVVHHYEAIDDPEQHQGRTRSFKHERGNWATLVYLDYKPSEAMRTWMTMLLEKLPVKCNVSTDRLHISVTRTLILKFHWIELFIEDLRKLCQHTGRCSLKLSNLQAYCNDEQTRTFLGIECLNIDGILDSFLTSLNKLLAEYNLPAFYENFSYHVSFLWCVGDEKERLNDAALSLNVALNEFLAEHVEDRYIYVNDVHIKTGNQLYAFKLK